MDGLFLPGVYKRGCAGNRESRESREGEIREVREGEIKEIREGEISTRSVQLYTLHTLSTSRHLVTV